MCDNRRLLSRAWSLIFRAASLLSKQFPPLSGCKLTIEHELRHQP
jgi:hypothetical protein